jgi:excisionase family DNA binding protein
MTITELAEYLRLPQSTLAQLVREGAIPGMKVGSDWRLHRQAVDQYIRGQSKS